MPQTLANLLNWGKSQLKNSGVDDFDISAELILRSLTNFSRSELLLNLGSEADSKMAEKYKVMIEKRCRRVPLQYLLGEVEFHNVKLKVDSRALIPRPETETLVETVIARLKGVDRPRILDIGTGSGNIAIALAKNISRATVDGVDISSEALELAAHNAQLNDISQSLNFRKLDILDAEAAGNLGLYDCVVSNPPYIAGKDRDKLQLEIIEHEPEIALFSGDDPLRFFKTIVGIISYILRRGGLLAFEVGIGQANDVSRSMNDEFRDIEIAKDLAGIKRVVTGFYEGFDKK